MKKILSFIALFGLLTACATSEKYGEILDSWIGATELQLVSQWGVPDSVYEASKGTKYLTYRSSGSITIPGQSPNYQTTVYGNTAYTQSYGGSAPITIDYFCETTFRITNRRVMSWSAKGNDCKA